jgi:hypothetical protein
MPRIDLNVPLFTRKTMQKKPGRAGIRRRGFGMGGIARTLLRCDDGCPRRRTSMCGRGVISFCALGERAGNPSYIFPVGCGIAVQRASGVNVLTSLRSNA